MSRLLWVVLLNVAFLAVHGETPAATPSGKKLVIAYAAMNARVCPLWAPRERGFFAKYGFDAEPLFVRGAPTLVAAMSSNEIEVGYTGGTAVIGAVASGSDLKVLSALTNRVTYELVARPGIKTPEDLRGKKFGVQAIGGTVWMGAILALEHLGLDPERDKIAIIAAGDQSRTRASGGQGTIDATVLDGVQSRPLARQGAHHSRRTRQDQIADPEFLDCRERALYSEKPAAGGKCFARGDRRGGILLVGAAETQYAEDLAKVSAHIREGCRGRLSRYGHGPRP